MGLTAIHTNVLTADVHKRVQKDTCFFNMLNYIRLCYQGSWKQQIRQRLSNMRRPGKRIQDDADKENQPTQPTQPPPKKTPSNTRAGSIVEAHTDEDSDTDSYEEKVQKLQTELASGKPSRKVIRRLMRATHTKRRAWILSKDAPCVATVIEVFPCLKTSKYVSATHYVYVWE